MGIFKVSVTKGGDLIEVDTDKLPEEVFSYVVQLGLKHMVNGKMGKVTKAAQPDDEARKAEAMAIAADNVENMYSGNVRAPVGLKVAKAKGPAKGKQTTLARANCRVLVKEEAKRQGIKISHIGAKEITRLADIILNDPVEGPIQMAKAAAELEAIESKSLANLIHIEVDQRKVKQAVDKAARAKPEGLSKTQVSIPEPHVIAATAANRGVGQNLPRR
jgi:hypothetical protein